MAAGSLALCWSGGKDSTLALSRLTRAGTPPSALFTTLTDDDRVTIHRVGRELIGRQADSLGIPLATMSIPDPCPNDEYARLMAEALDRPPLDTAARIAFGDLFLEDIRAFREERIAAIGRQGVFPLWGEPTAALAERFVAEGHRAVIVSVDLSALDQSYLGRELDRSLLADLPPEVDPCGENGEFHTFVFDGPLMSRPVEFVPGEATSRDGFAWLELRPS